MRTFLPGLLCLALLSAPERTRAAAPAGSAASSPAARRWVPGDPVPTSDALRDRFADRANHPYGTARIIEPAAWTYDAEGIHSVATAGDVNGDGYSDVLVGAPYFDNDQLNEGRVFLFLGSSSGPSAVADWTAEGDQVGAHFGYSVSAAGDLNGDGYDDVIIGVPDLDIVNPITSELIVDTGDAFVYFGSVAGLGAVPDYRISEGLNLTPGGQRGFAVAGVGDVDGDGYADAAVGTPYYDFIVDEDHGRVDILAGGPAAFPSDVYFFHGASGERLGTQLAPAGDVNGDRFDDVAASGASQVYVFHGHVSGPSTPPDWSPANLGGVVATLGDVNGDGYADVGVGTPEASPGGSGAASCAVLSLDTAGKSRVFLGSAAGLQPDPFLTVCGAWIATAGDVNGDGFADVIQAKEREVCSCDNPFCNGLPCGIYAGFVRVLRGSPSSLTQDWIWGDGPQFAFALATAGDVNGDGYGDVLIRAGGGTHDVYLFYGAARGLATSPGWNSLETQVEMYQGYSVAGVGDVNGDGYSDFAVGAPLWNGPELDEGRVTLFPGTSVPAIVFQSDQAGANLGISVAGAGDVNGDGYSDIIAGAPTYSNGEAAEGRAYVYLGSANLAAFPTWTAESDQADAWFGFSVASAGDVNGDGYADVLIGAPLYDGGQMDEGRVYLYLGSATGLALAPAWTVEGEQADAHLGWSVAGAGDVNGDGLSDVVIGVPQFSNGQANEGRIVVYPGIASGLGAIPSATLEGAQVGAKLGWSVAGAGDLNGDGYSDIVAGAPYADYGQTDEGAALVCHGSAGGVVTDPPAWARAGDQDFARFGSAVSGAGDVDGDGYRDVVVGASGYTGPEADEGRAYLFPGTAGGLALVATWTAEMNQADAAFGFAVAGVGDVNGDGFGEVVVGAPYFDLPVGSVGRAWLYYGNGASGLDRGPPPYQARSDGSAPIDLLGRTDDHQFRIKALGRSSGGRARVGLEWEVKPLGTAFDGTLSAGSRVDTGAPLGAAGSSVPLNELVSGLSAGIAYHWRVRIASESPLFPHSRWYSPPGNAGTETDLRDGIALTDVPNAAHLGPEPRLEPGAPNPFGSGTTIHFVLPTTLPVTLSVFDLGGRLAATLVRDERGPGRFAAVWTGRNVRGNRMPAGIYIVRLQAGTAVRSTRLVHLPGLR